MFIITSGTGCSAVSPIVSGVPSNIAFNLALPTIFALAAVNVYAIGTLLLDRFRWLPLLTFLIPNPSFFWQIVQGKALGSVVWDSTRTITNTINEYPLFSFIWGDVHAHVVSIFNQCFLIFLLLFAYKLWETLDRKGKVILGILGAISLGSMPLINTWDVLIYAPITVFVASAHPSQIMGHCRAEICDSLPYCPAGSSHRQLPAVLHPAPDPYGRDRYRPGSLGPG